MASRSALELFEDELLDTTRAGSIDDLFPVERPQAPVGSAARDLEMVREQSLVPGSRTFATPGARRRPGWLETMLNPPALREAQFGTTFGPEEPWNVAGNIGRGLLRTLDLPLQAKGIAEMARGLPKLFSPETAVPAAVSAYQELRRSKPLREAAIHPVETALALVPFANLPGALRAQRLSRAPRAARGAFEPAPEAPPPRAGAEPPGSALALFEEAPGRTAAGNVYRAVGPTELAAIRETGQIKSGLTMALPVEKHFGLTGFAATPEDAMLYAKANLQAEGKAYIIEVKKTPEMRSDWGEIPTLIARRDELAAESATLKQTISKSKPEERPLFEDWLTKNTEDLAVIEQRLSGFGELAQRPMQGIQGVRLPYPMTPRAVSATNISRVWEVTPEGKLIEAPGQTAAATPKGMGPAAERVPGAPTNALALFESPAATEAQARVPPAPPRIPPPPAAPPPRPPAGGLPPSEPPPPPPPPSDVALRPTYGRVTGGMVGQDFGLDKLALADDAQQAVTGRLKSLGLTERRVQTFADVREAASELGLDADALLTAALERPLTAPEVLAVHDQAAAHANAYTKALETGDAKNAARAMRELDRSLTGLVSAGRTAGRTVAAFRQIAEQTHDPTTWYQAAKRELGPRPFTREIKAAIDDQIAAANRIGLAQVVGSLHKSSLVDKIITVWRVNLLDNPATTSRNLSGNVTGISLDEIARLPAAALDWGASLISGKPRTVMAGGMRLAGMARGVAAGVRAAGQVLRKGGTPEQLARYDFNQQVNFDSPILRFYTQGVLRSLGAGDVLFREPALSGTIAELAVMKARNAGLKGEAFLLDVQRTLRQPDADMLKLAREDAAYRVFQQPSATAALLEGVIRRQPAAKVAINVAMAFRRTPINIAKFTVDFSPFGMPKEIVKALYRRHQGTFSRRYFMIGMGRSMIGTAVAGLGWYFYKTGRATGSAPDDPEERNLRRALGIPDNAIKIGDSWVELTGIAPASTVFLLGINAAQQAARPVAGYKKVLGTALSIPGTLLEQPFLTGPARMLEAIVHPERYGGTWAEQLIGSLVPSIVGATARGTSPYRPRIEGIGQALKARIPGLRSQLEPQIDISGRPVPRRKGLAAELFSPVAVTTPRRTLASRVYQAAQWAPGLPQEHFTVSQREDGVQRRGTVRLSGKHLTRFLEQMGTATDRAATDLAYFVGSPESPEWKAERLKSRIEHERNRVRQDWRRWALSYPDSASIDWRGKAPTPAGGE